MSFLYPLFLVAGLCLAIPVLIHLFNLRRYKTIYFPHTRFLRNIQLNSRRQSQVRYKWLLVTRLLFLTALILAFAQPFFPNANQKDAGNRLQLIYLDNSASMSVKKGARTLFDVARDRARKQVTDAAPGTKFILLTNDKLAAYQPMAADKILAELNQTDISPVNKTADQILTTAQNLLQTEAATGADLYYYSDFQQNTFPAKQDEKLTAHINLFALPVQPDVQQNIYIDTAYLATPVLQTGQSNQLIVHTRVVGDLQKDAPVMQLSVNGQVKSATSLGFNDRKESTDTLSFQVNDASWQKILLTLNDVSVRFDDTFRITARSAPSLSVLALNEGQANPYIQAAFRSYNGFRLNQVNATDRTANWKDYDLVIFDGLTHIDKALGKLTDEAMQQGQSICIFPGKTANLAALNEGLQQMGDITLTGLDTAAQTTGNLQQGNELVRDLFENIPDNVQLPRANWHYIIHSGLSANQQSILSFRNGDPFLARYMPSKGQLYISASAADLQSGNFPGSYFFAPFLYQMAIKSQGGSIYALTAGRQQAAYLPLSNANERNVIHLHANGVDVIPPQRASGPGLDIYIDQAVQQPGFYDLSATGTDTSVVALNLDRTESQLNTWNISKLKNGWQGSNIHWIDAADTGNMNSTTGWGGFPLWKVCVILALVMLAAETVLLAGRFKQQTAATQ